VHAFAAAPASNADLLIILSPGIERFEYFRHLQRIHIGQAPLESIREMQDLYDNHFDDSPVWQDRLATRSCQMTSASRPNVRWCRSSVYTRQDRSGGSGTRRL
jgi:hypothetical protein